MRDATYRHFVAWCERTIGDDEDTALRMLAQYASDPDYYDAEGWTVLRRDTEALPDERMES